ncbi:MAG TPA: SDR family NAD(P)-dependent oxidoreductase, partial [Longimicrobium sp.]|nr:SDR family NAD(P)-dependent oxidoreductase [Longimicrobium sp.]
LRWLDLLERHRVAHSWAPNFGYRLVSDALGNAPRRSWRLAHVKRLMNGGEQVTVEVARDFLARVEPFGIRPAALEPVYGMAELCTAVTYEDDFDVHRSVRRVVRSSLGGPLELRDDSGGDTISFIEVGKPCPGVQLRIVDAENRLLPEGVIGRLQVHGDVVTPGYVNNDAANHEAFTRDGWFNTGDTGFLLGGRLTVTGREKEMIIVRGSHLYCHDLEERARRVAGVERAAACGVEATAKGTEGFAIFFVAQEGGTPDDARLAASIRASITADFGMAPTYVVPLTRDQFPTTTSGKLQRESLKKALAAGTFAPVIEKLELQQGSATHTVPDWFFRRAWKRSEAAVRASPPRGTVLLLADGQGLAAEVAEALRRAGRRCVMVEAAEAFARLGPDAFRIRPEDADGYEALLAALGAESALPSQILHLWTFDGPEPLAPSGGLRARGGHSLLLLGRALARSPASAGSVRLHVVSTGAQPVRPGEPVACEKALLLGLVQTLPRELPWLDARHLDLPAAAPAENARRVLRELDVARHEREVAYRDGQRLVPRLERVELAARGRRAPPFRVGGTYLVSGGLGGVGLELSRRLLEDYGARLLLIGRTPLEGLETTGRGGAYEALRALAARHGGEVLYTAADVADADRLRHAAREAEARWGEPLDGILHLAGVLEARPLAEESLEHFDALLRPKVEGTLALLRLLEERPGAFLVAFSSVNAAFGGFAVGAYAAANRFMEHAVHAHRARGARCYALAWSGWRPAAPTGADERLARARGFQSIPPARGWTSLLIGLGQPPGELLIGLDGDHPHVRSHLEGAPVHALELVAFHALRPGAPPPGEAPPPPADQFGTPVAGVVRRVEQLPRTPAGDVDFSALVGAAERPAGRVPPRDEMERRVAALWREELGVDEVGALDNFFELGAHSMMLSRVTHRLERELERAVPVLELFRHPTVRALAAHLSGGGL